MVRQGGKVVIMFFKNTTPYDTIVETRTPANLQKPTKPAWIVGDPVEITMKTNQNKIAYSTLKGNGAILVLKYGYLGTVPEHGFRLAKYNSKSKKWEYLNSIQKKKEKEVAAVVKDLGGIYAIIGGTGFESGWTGSVAGKSVSRAVEPITAPDSIFTTPMPTPEETVVVTKTTPTTSATKPVMKQGLRKRIVDFLRIIFRVGK